MGFISRLTVTAAPIKREFNPNKSDPTKEGPPSSTWDSARSTPAPQEGFSAVLTRGQPRSSLAASTEATWRRRRRGSVPRKRRLADEIHGFGRWQRHLGQQLEVPLVPINLGLGIDEEDPGLVLQIDHVRDPGRPRFQD